MEVRGLARHAGVDTPEILKTAPLSYRIEGVWRKSVENPSQQ